MTYQRKIFKKETTDKTVGEFTDVGGADLAAGGDS